MNKKSLLALAAIGLISMQAQADLESNFYLKGGVGTGRIQTQNDTLTSSALHSSIILLGSASIGAYLSPVIRLEAGGIINGTAELSATGIKLTTPNFQKDFDADASHIFNINSGFVKAYVDFSFDEGKFFIFGGPLMSRVTEVVKYKFVPSTKIAETTPNPSTSAPVTTEIQPKAADPTYITGAILGIGVAFPVSDDIELHIEGNYRHYGTLPVISEAENTAQVIAPASTIKYTYNVEKLSDITGTASLVLNLN